MDTSPRQKILALRRRGGRKRHLNHPHNHSHHHSEGVRERVGVSMAPGKGIEASVTSCSSSSIGCGGSSGSNGRVPKKRLPARRKTSRPSSRTALKMAAAVAAAVPLPAFLAVTSLASVAAAAAAAASKLLRPQSELTSHCFGFPTRGFDPGNCVEAVNNGHTPYLPMVAGDGAIDFTLHDLRGEAWSLSETLERTDAPVVMIWGMFTCPGFQGYGTEPPWDMDSYKEEYELVDAYKDRATFVHLYGPEPHPKIPGTNFDKGTLWPHYWSMVSQHHSYEDRVAMANRISNLIHPDQKILPDYFPGNPYSDLVQPVWCSYAMAARAVTMVSPSGALYFQRAWFHAEHVSGAIDNYWCERLAEAQVEHESGDRGRAATSRERWSSSWSTLCAKNDTAGGEDESWPDGVPPLARA